MQGLVSAIMDRRMIAEGAVKKLNDHIQLLLFRLLIILRGLASRSALGRAG